MIGQRSSVQKHLHLQTHFEAEKEAGSTVNTFSKSLTPQERSDSFSITSGEWWIIDGNYNLIPEKFFSHYQDYEKDQVKLNKLWEKVEVNNLKPTEFKRHQLNVLNTEWKSLIRKGIPLNKFRTIILEIFKKTHHNVDIEYSSALEVAFKGPVPETFKNVPLFTDSEGLDIVLHTHFLNNEGLEAFTRIMWVFQKNIPRLEYSPILPQIVSLMLIFLKEGEAYVITKMILEESDKMLNSSGKMLHESIDSLRWHVTFKKEDFTRCLALIPIFCKRRGKTFDKLERHFKKIGFKYEEMLGFWLRNLFLNFLPLHIVLRIFACYLNEGIKVYYKFSLSFLKLFRDDILRHKDPHTLIQTLKEKALKLTQAQCDRLVGKAYARSLGSILRPKTMSKKVKIEREEAESIKLYLPKLDEPSAVINSHQLETIWKWLPEFFKPTQPLLAYSTKKHGWSLQTLYSKAHHKSCHGIVFLIKTVEGQKFGAFIDNELPVKRTGTEYCGTDKSFVFQLEPQDAKYTSARNNKSHLLCDPEYLSIGTGGDGPAIYLNEELSRGFSYRSETYNNDQFNQGKDKFNSAFTCAAIEVYLLE